MFHLLIHKGFQFFRKQKRQLSFSTMQTGLRSVTSALGKSSSQQNTQTQLEFNKAKGDEFSVCSQQDRAKKAMRRVGSQNIISLYTYIISVNQMWKPLAILNLD